MKQWMDACNGWVDPNYLSPSPFTAEALERTLLEAVRKYPDQFRGEVRDGNAYIECLRGIGSWYSYAGGPRVVPIEGTYTSDSLPFYVAAVALERR